MTETPQTPFRPLPSSGSRRAPRGGVSLRRQADRSNAPPRDPAGEERGLPVSVGAATVVVKVKFLFPSDLRALGVAEWLPDTERYAADRAKHVALLAAVEAARQARTGLPAEIGAAEGQALQHAFDAGDAKNGAPRPDAAKLMKQADEKLALRQAELVRWADGVLGRVVAEADTVLADNEAQQDRLHEAQEQAQRALDAATASLRAAQRMEIWTRSARAEPSTTVGIPVWSALVDAPYPKAEPRGGV